tara:strand:- start:498 stop:1490 length:993 start_codon:yes stop_codon:yes gene_type:complete
MMDSKSFRNLTETSANIIRGLNKDVNEIVGAPKKRPAGSGHPIRPDPKTPPYAMTQKVTQSQKKLPRQLVNPKSEMMVTSPKGKTFVINKSQWKDHEASGHTVAEGVELGESHDSRELHLFTSNHPDVHRQRTNPVHKNLRNKMARGTYDTTKAHKAFMHIARDGSKAYDKAHGHKFDKDAIHQTATTMQNEFESEAKDGQHDHHLYKKYKSSAVTKKDESMDLTNTVLEVTENYLKHVKKQHDSMKREKKEKEPKERSSLEKWDDHPPGFKSQGQHRKRTKKVLDRVAKNDERFPNQSKFAKKILQAMGEKDKEKKNINSANQRIARTR